MIIAMKNTYTHQIPRKTMIGSFVGWSELDTRVSSVFRFTIASWLFPIVLGGTELHGRSAKGVWVSFAPLKTSC